LSNQSLFRAFEMEKKGWVLVDPGSQAGLDASMAKAAQRDDNWLGYYWSPTAPVGKYKMQLMDFGVPFAGADNWDGCVALGPEKCSDPKPSAWTESVVQTVVTPQIKAMPDVMGYFGNRIYPGPIMNGMLVYMEDNQSTGPDAALEFLDKHQDVWTKWVSADVAAKVKKSL
jgi:glycine betaine/proline transport system substrate-binding protein